MKEIEILINEKCENRFQEGLAEGFMVAQSIAFMYADNYKLRIPYSDAELRDFTKEKLDKLRKKLT